MYNLLKKTILSFSSTEKIKVEVGTAEQCLFIARDATGKAKFDQYPLPTSPNIQMSTDWNVMPSDWDDYTLDIKLLKHYQSIIGVLI